MPIAACVATFGLTLSLLLSGTTYSSQKWDSPTPQNTNEVDCAKILGSAELGTNFSLSFPLNEQIRQEFSTQLHSRTVENWVQIHSNVNSDLKGRVQSFQQHYADVNRILCQPETAYVETLREVIAGVLEQLYGAGAQIELLAKTYDEIKNVYDDLLDEAAQALDDARLTVVQTIYLDGEPWLFRHLGFNPVDRWYEPLKAKERKMDELRTGGSALDGEIKRLERMQQLLRRLKPALYNFYASPGERQIELRLKVPPKSFWTNPKKCLHSIKTWFGGLFGSKPREPHEKMKIGLEEWFRQHIHNDEMRKILGELAQSTKGSDDHYNQKL